MLIESRDAGPGLSLEQFSVRSDRTQGRSQIVAGAQEKSTELTIGGYSARSLALSVAFAGFGRQHEDTVPQCRALDSVGDRSFDWA